MIRGVKQLTERLSLIHQQGRQAFINGYYTHECPHTNKADALAWRNGYNYQQRDDRHCIYDGEWLNKRTA